MHQLLFFHFPFTSIGSNMFLPAFVTESGSRNVALHEVRY